MRSVLSSILNLDKPKVLEKGTWLAVSYEDNWYPGQITIKIEVNSVLPQNIGLFNVQIHKMFTILYLISKFFFLRPDTFARFY
jgi:hypothetical protein